MKEKSENYMSLINEVIVTIYLYTLISITDFNPNIESKSLSSLILLCVVFIAFGLNLLMVVVISIRQCWINRFKKSRKGTISNYQTNREAPKY